MSLYVFLCVVVASVSVFLVAHCKYEDGVIGKIALACLAIGNLVVFAEWFNGINHEVNPTTLFIQFGIAGFLVRHAYRFKKWTITGANDWRKNETSSVSNDVVCPLLTSRNGNSKPRRKRNADVLQARS